MNSPELAGDENRQPVVTDLEVREMLARYYRARLNNWRYIVVTAMTDDDVPPENMVISNNGSN